MLNRFYSQLKTNVNTRKNYLCVGLDPDLSRLGANYTQSIGGLKQHLFDVIQLTQDYCVCYKPNISFFEALGIEGLRLLESVCKKIPPSVPIIIDAKRGDIGNTAKMQARYIFDYFGASATTLHPYMGSDSLIPFFEYKDKYHFVLCLTSNPSASEFEMLTLSNGLKLHDYIMDFANQWDDEYGNVGLVVGATNTAGLNALRVRNDKSLFLVPGVGSQGGSYHDVAKLSLNNDGLTLINISRYILYPPVKTSLSSHINFVLDFLSKGE